jgi:hypothetical protein
LFCLITQGNHCNYAITQPCKHKVITQHISKNIAHATFAFKSAII